MSISGHPKKPLCTVLLGLPIVYTAPPLLTLHSLCTLEPTSHSVVTGHELPPDLLHPQHYSAVVPCCLFSRLQNPFERFVCNCAVNRSMHLVSTSHPQTCCDALCRMYFSLQLHKDSAVSHACLMKNFTSLIFCRVTRRRRGMCMVSWMRSSNRWKTWSAG